MSARPAPVVLAAPSGAGKTTIAHALVDRYDEFVFSVSATTREPRGEERDGEDYDFLSVDEFRRMIEAGELVEWAEVHGSLYGTPVDALERARRMGKHPVLDIDVQGARQIRQRIQDAVLIFILPPSGEVLGERLTGRGTEESEAVRGRLEAALAELDEATSFDHVVVNENLDQAVSTIRGVIAGTSTSPTLAAEMAGEVARVKRGLERLLESPGGPGPT